MIQALEAQLGKEGYTVTDAMLRERGNDLKKFNREQQAVIAEEFRGGRQSSQRTTR